MREDWIAHRMSGIDASGIRKVFDLAAKLKDPIDLSIGQPDFDVPEPIKKAAIQAIQQGQNGYTVTQGIRDLRDKLTHRMKSEYDHSDRELVVTSGTSGGLVLALQVMINPGDEVIVFDPYFVMYAHLVRLAGGVPVFVDTYPDFALDLDKVEQALTDRTKLILFNSPSNPTGAVASADEVKGLAELALKHNVALLSDEVYRSFCYDDAFLSPAKWNPETIVVDGFSKSHGMTGWRLGFIHGPGQLMKEIAKLQQFTFVCAPHPVQVGGAAGVDLDLAAQNHAYKARRDMIRSQLSDLYEINGASGAFYLFPRVPWGTGSSFVTEAINRGLLVIPGNVFSESDSHFRISFAAPEETLQRGISVLRELACNPPLSP